MTLRVLLLLAAVLAFLLAAISAFADSVNLNEIGFLAIGLALLAASFFAFVDRRVT